MRAGTTGTVRVAEVMALTLALALLAGAFAGARAQTPTDFSASNLSLDPMLFDARVNGSLGAWPGMRQSLTITKSAYYAAHAGMLGLVAPPGEDRGAAFKHVGMVLLADFVLTWLPAGDAWLHEEWHRAVMSRRDIDSYNGVYDLELLAEAIPVRKVRDEDLIRLKRDHPAEMVRLSSAGFEAQLSLNLEFDKDRFFRGTRAGAVVTQWLQTANSIAYMMVAAYDSEDTTEAILREEGTDVSERDFTGLDPVGWVYDLYRPDEPYEARGLHPSGVGIDRYRSESDLTSGELRTLRTQAWLSLVNLADPNLYGFYGFPVGRVGAGPARFNASAQHYLAPFGYSIFANVFIATGRLDGFARLQAHVSDSLVLPGLTLELVRHPLWPRGVRVTPGVQVWMQPEAQRYRARSGQWGGAAELRFHVPLYGRIEAYVEGTLKTEGWIPGDVFLGRSANAALGIEALVF